MARHIPSEDWSRKELCDILLLEAFTRNLEDEFNQRRKTKRPYTEDELWQIADACICALAKM
jgi:hypothetical protein